ncbi:MAG: dienelactone hydrolase family protein [Rhizobiales bacterium]|nr:dienelactone hydrolase family protein [Hyphomicrobiales bacterium]OJY43708.1 MAG: hypothetical protein BGP08_09265 [Rhizobiales bacterium 64-17]
MSEISVAAADGKTFQVYLAGDAPSRRPAIILFSPIFGIDANVREIADRWADRGYLVAVPDYFFRVLPGILDRSESGRKQAMDRWKQLDVGKTIEDMRALKETLLSNPHCNGKLGSLGYCAGGELAFLAATRLGAEAVAGFHATRINQHLSEAERIVGRVTLHFGSNDNLVPLSQVDAIKAAVGSNTKVDIAVYDGAGHGFSFQGQPSYHAEAESRSDERAQAVLGTLKTAA